MEATSRIAAPLPAPLPQILREFLAPVLPDPAALTVLLAASDANIRAPALSAAFLSDPGYLHYLISQSFLSERMHEWREETGSRPDSERLFLERILGLLGKVPVRNLMACARLVRLQNPSASMASPKEPDQKINTIPSQMIPLALEAENTCLNQNWVEPEAAFSAGLHYDWLGGLIKSQKSAGIEEKNALSSAYKEGLLTAKIAYQLGLGIKEIRLGRHLFPAGLLLPIGKALMAALFPKRAAGASWPKFLSDCEKAGEYRFDFLRYLEKRRFPVTHAELSSLFVSFAALLPDIERSLYFYQDPGKIKQVSPDQYQLSVLISISNRIANTAQKGGLAFEPFQREWLQTNGISEAFLKDAEKKAQRP